MNPLSTKRLSPARWPAALLLLAACATPVLAAGKQPLVLDTRTGISDGQSGIVLQTAPLSPAPMVQAQSLPTLGGQPANASPPIIVSPYIEMPGSQGTRSSQRSQTVRTQRTPTLPTSQSSQ